MDDNFKLKFKNVRKLSTQEYKEKSKYPFDLLELLEDTSINDHLQSHTEGITVNELGLKKPSLWKAYTSRHHKGLLLVKGCFTVDGETYWASQCLYSYPLSPSKTNIGTLDMADYQRLRWATIGYHHDWDTKVYRDDNRSHFPPDLKRLIEKLAEILGFYNFVAEAGIINYYHMNSTLSGHTDHSELNKDAPLFSISFGQSALFLLGGLTKEEDPSIIKLESGDVLIMSGESRLCYHGVPRILKSEKQTWLFCDSHGRTLSYLNNNRININVRQVNFY
ncbi:nucleic acid dioxygenase ALKBH1-like [Artemia franciscana]|uniref:nucleic acid dioxygenase ALKBH1-like n=1 Tax=Artemia franciscana TaxID=6661 RepID=UPI0032DB81B9